MTDPIASPGDPVFYLHHTYLDKVFSDWQALDLPARLTDIGGQTLQLAFPIPSDLSQPFTPPPDFLSNGDGPPIIMPSLGAGPPPDAMRPLPGAPVQRAEGNPGNETTLSQILNMFGVIPNATIADVMDVGGPLLCYEYV